MATITTIQSTDQVSDSRAVINTNFANLNTDKLEAPITIAQGGTGQTSYTDGQLLIGATSGNTLAKATLTGTADEIEITNGTSSITLNIASTYAGGSSIVTVGTIATGTWEGTTIAVDQGGTGAATLTDGGVLLGSGTGAITPMAVLGDGAIIVGDGATDPVALTAFTSSTGTLKHESGGIEADISAIADGGILVGTGAGTMAIRASALTAGAAGFLKHEVGGLEFDVSAIAKGGIVAGTGAGTMAITTVGSNGNYLVADSASAGGVKWTTVPNYAADAEASDTYVITLDPAPTGYTTGMQVTFKANTTNTGASTLNVNGLGAVTIVKNQIDPMTNNDIIAGQMIQVVYDGTNFQMVSPKGIMTAELASLAAGATSGTLVTLQVQILYLCGLRGALNGAGHGSAAYVCYYGDSNDESCTEIANVGNGAWDVTLAVDGSGNVTLTNNDVDDALGDVDFVFTPICWSV